MARKSIEKISLVILSFGLPFSCTELSVNLSTASSTELGSTSDPNQDSSVSSVAISSQEVTSEADSLYYFSGIFDSQPEGTEGTKLDDPSYRQTADGINYVQIPNSDKLIFENESYVDTEEVAAYVQFFNKMPDNYIPKSQRDEVTENNDYVVTNGTFSNDGRDSEPVLPGEGTFTEMDIKDGYTYKGDGDLSNRGAQRLVFIQDDDDDYVFFTDDHYSDYREYLGYYGGWGSEFGKYSPNASYDAQVESYVGDYVQLPDGFYVTNWDYYPSQAN